MSASAATCCPHPCHCDEYESESMTPTDLLTTAAVADLLGIAPATWRAYVSRQQAPAPDGRHDARTPYWRRETIEAWRPNT